MLRSYWKLAIRHIRRNLLISFINILGLALGLACCLSIFLFVKDELSFDKFHEKANRIYQVLYTTSNGLKLAQVPPPISPLMVEVHPEVETSARMFPRNLSVTIRKGGIEKQFEEEDVFFADSTLIDIFSFEVASGNPSSFLVEPGTVWLEEKIAEKYFPDSNPLGETIFINGNQPFRVAGVLKDFPGNSHIHFNMLLPYEDMYNLEHDEMEAVMRDNLGQNWVISHSLTYVLLKEGSDAAAVDARFDQMIQTHAPEPLRLGQKFSLTPLKDIHLLAGVELEPEPLGSMQYIYIFSGIAFLTLLIACFNFINLSTAESIKRSREVGMRKVLGARSNQLFGQFMGESTVLTLFAFLLALALLYYAIPLLNQLSDKSLAMEQLLDWKVAAAFLTIFAFTALLGGSYPSLFISRMKALETIKGKLQLNHSRFSMRRTLVMLQFAISIMLIAGSAIIYKQLRFLQNQPLGFQTKAVITVPILNSSLNNIFGGVNQELRQRLNVFSEQLKNRSGIRATTISSNIPGVGATGRYVTVEGKDPEKPEIVYNLQVDYDFATAYELDIIVGRDFNKSAGTDHTQAVIINETAVRNFNWESPENALGKKVNLEGKEAEVIGVVKDFHTTSLHNPIQPLILDVHVPGFNTLSVIAENGRLPETLAYIETEWQKHFPEKSFEYSFLDSELHELYQAETRLGKVIGIFSALAILVSCMGAYGLMMFTTRQRQKEVGIRRVLGASVFQIVAMLLKEFSVLLGIGFLLGIPLIWWWSKEWLQEFSYKVDLDLITFILSGLFCLLLVWLTVSIQTVRAANCNPSDVLRDD